MGITIKDLRNRCEGMGALILNMIDSLDTPGRTELSKREFMAMIRGIEDQCAILKADVIKHSRKIGAGVTKDGRPDHRFKTNRTKEYVQICSRKPVDLRCN